MKYRFKLKIFGALICFLLLSIAYCTAQTPNIPIQREMLLKYQLPITPKDSLSSSWTIIFKNSPSKAELQNIEDTLLRSEAKYFNLKSLYDLKIVLLQNDEKETVFEILIFISTGTEPPVVQGCCHHFPNEKNFPNVDIVFNNERFSVSKILNQ